MGKKDAPKAPDPVKTADTQLAFGKQAAQDTLRMNAINQHGPFGSSTFVKDAQGNPTGIKTSLSSALQGSADNLTGNLDAQTGLLPSGSFNPNVDAAGIRQAYMDSAALAAQPEWARQDKATELMLAERGIPIGSEIWGDVQDKTAEGRNAFLRGAANDAFIAGTQEEQRQRGNQLQDFLLPYQTAQNSLGLLQGMNTLVPRANQPQASVAAPNFAQMAQNQFQAEMDAHNNQMSGLGQLASTGLGLLTTPLTGPMGLSNTLLGRAFL